MIRSLQEEWNMGTAVEALYQEIHRLFKEAKQARLIFEDSKCYVVLVKTPKYWYELVYHPKKGTYGLDAHSTNVPGRCWIDVNTRRIVNLESTNDELLEAVSELKKALIVPWLDNILFKWGKGKEPLAFAMACEEKKRLKVEVWVAEGEATPSELRSLTPQSFWQLCKNGKLQLLTEHEGTSMCFLKSTLSWLVHQRLGWKNRIFLPVGDGSGKQVPLSDELRTNWLNKPESAWAALPPYKTQYAMPTLPN